MRQWKAERRYSQVFERSYKFPCTGQFYCFIAWLRWCSKCYSYLCTGKNKFGSHIALSWCRGSQAFLIYLIQIVVVGFIGSLAGAALGTIIQQFLPIALKDFLPVKVDYRTFVESDRAGFIIRSCDLFSFCLIATDIHSQSFSIEYAAFIISTIQLI